MTAVLHASATFTDSETLQTGTLNVQDGEEREANIMLRSGDPQEIADWILRVRRDACGVAGDVIHAHDNEDVLDGFSVDREDFEVRIRNVGTEAVHRAAARRAEDNTFADNASEQLLIWLSKEEDDGRIEEFRYRCREIIEDVYIDPGAGEF